MNDTKSQILPSKLDELICFALYSANNAVNRSYRSHLDKIGLTYPQYIVLVALWEKENVTVGQLCERLFLETSTLTPVLKRLESLGYVTRKRHPEDERKVSVGLTTAGKQLQKKSPEITKCIIRDTGKEIDELCHMVESLKTMRTNLTSKD